MEDIIIKRGKIRNESLIIHDAYIDAEDRILLLCDYNDCQKENSFFWVSSKQIQASKIENYIDQLKHLTDKNESISCNSSKKYTLPCNKKSRTVGVFLAVFNCGIICSYKEIFQHESINQVATFLLEIIEKSNFWPYFIVYDDACHLSKFISNKASFKFSNTTQRGKILSETKFSVDRFHFKTHTDMWCEKYCDPEKFSELQGINTSVCEQTNFWLSRYKFAMKHMNYERFHLFLYILCDKYNDHKIIEHLYIENKSKN